MFPNHSTKKPCPPGEEASERRPKGKRKGKGKKPAAMKKRGIMDGPMGKALLGK